MFAAQLIAASALAIQITQALVLETGSVPFWPYPSGDVIVGNTHLLLDKGFTFSTETETTNSILKEAFSRYEEIIGADKFVDTD